MSRPERTAQLGCDRRQTFSVDLAARPAYDAGRSGARSAVLELLDRHGLDTTIAWTLGGEPFLTPVGTLSEALTAA